jgi:hypothetical protein
MANTQTGALRSPQGNGEALKIRWDDTNMRSSYANVCNVASTREEVVLLFGLNQTWQSGQDEVVIQLLNRVILNPFAAKRLLTLLANVLREYEARFSGLSLQADGEDASRVTQNSVSA